KCACGGSDTCDHCRLDDAPGIQRKVVVGPCDDAYESEADAVADDLTRMIGPGFMRSAPHMIQPKCPSNQDGTRNSDHSNSSTTPNVEAATEADIAVRAATGGGRPLPMTLRSYIEPRLGHDLSGVRIHTDSVAATAARSVHARAYTFGNDVVFA